MSQGIQNNFIQNYIAIYNFTSRWLTGKYNNWNLILSQFMISQENDFDLISCNYDTIYSEKNLLSIFCDISVET